MWMSRSIRWCPGTISPREPSTATVANRALARRILSGSFPSVLHEQPGKRIRVVLAGIVTRRSAALEISYSKPPDYI